MDIDDQRDDGHEGDELEAEIVRADHPFAADERSTSPKEALDGLSIDEAFARERPEGSTVDEAVGIEDDGVPDVEDELVAEGSLEQDDFASPEESALSIRDDAPGATDHDDPASIVERSTAGSPATRTKASARSPTGALGPTAVPTRSPPEIEAPLDT